MKYLQSADLADIILIAAYTKNNSIEHSKYLRYYITGDLKHLNKIRLTYARAIKKKRKRWKEYNKRRDIAVAAINKKSTFYLYRLKPPVKNQRRRGIG